MRVGALLLIACAMLATTRAYADSTSVWEGNIRVGGVIEDEEGDRSVMQETFNIHEGFTVTKLRLNGRFNRNTHLYLDADNITLDGRRGTIDLRRTGVGHFRSRYDENEFLFDPAGATVSTRRDWLSNLTLTPQRWLSISGEYNLQTRRGDRAGFPAGTNSAIGDAYDSNLNRWRAQVQGNHRSGVAASVTYDGVALTDQLDERNERDANVVSANVRLPGFVFDRLTHVVRGSVGKSELPAAGTSFDLLTVQYTGILAPWRPLRLKYRFYAAQVDDKAEDNQTDRWIHDIDGEYRWRAATLTGGYGWEAWDDDRSVTTYDNVRAALFLRHPRQVVTGSVSYSNRTKEDEEDRTLLRNTEYARAEARIDARPLSGLTVGGRVAERTREMPDIGAEAEGWAASAYGEYRYQYAREARTIATTLGVDYRYADDDYDNATGGEYHVTSHFVTGRVDLEVYESIHAGAAVHFITAEEDMDIEKSILSFELGYTFRNTYDAKVKYNVYNYDDFLVANRYYTANIVWIDVGYALSAE